MSAKGREAATAEIAYGYVAYQLLVSVLGAFAFAIFLAHFVHTDWHGILAWQAASMRILSTRPIFFSWR